MGVLSRVVNNERQQLMAVPLDIVYVAMELLLMLVQVLL